MIRLATPVLTVFTILASLSVGVATSAWAAPITLVPNTLNMFRDTRGLNDVGIGQGDVFQYGGNVQGGSLGTTLGAVYPPTGFTDPPAPCAPLTVSPNQCANATGFNASRTASPWTFQFRNGPDALDVTGPALTTNSNAILNPVPFPVSVTISQGATPTTPIISWVITNTFAPDAYRITIFDRSAPTLPNGTKDVIHADAVAATATSYAIPATLTGGGSLALNNNYSIGFQVIETRNHVPFTNNNAEILRRSNSFFAFTPTDASGPPNVHLPQVAPDTDPNDNRGPVYVFSVESVGPNSVTFIDPVVAVGYEYAIGLGDPNFASVLLPDIGDGVYDVFFDNLHHAVLADQQFFFPQGGVSAFTVLGIEPSAELDPNNVNAFVTGLTFVTEGSFTGTMTPLTQVVTEAVPLPATVVLLGSGLAAMALCWRRRYCALSVLPGVVRKK
jgi:hypothetical protein